MNGDHDGKGKILIVQFSASRDGSTVSGLMLADGLKKAGWQTFVAFGHDGPMEQVYRNSGHETTVVGHKSWLRRPKLLHFLKDTFTEWRRAADFEKLMAALNPRVVYVNTSVSLAAVVAARRHGIPVVWHLRELFDELGGELKAPAILKPLVRSLFARLPQQVISNSRAVATNLLGKKQDEAIVIYNAIDDSYFNFEMSRKAARAKLGLETEGTIIGVPGTLRPVKGHPFFLKAAAEVCKSHPKIIFAIIGDGDSGYVAGIRQQTIDLELENNLVFLGTLERLHEFYRACDIICVPSKAESFGRVVIEAMAIGTPVVATRVGGIPEIIRSNGVGLLVEYDNVGELTEALQLLMIDKQFRNSLSESAKEFAWQEFSQDLVLESLSSAIEDSAQQSRVATATE